MPRILYHLNEVTAAVIIGDENGLMMLSDGINEPIKSTLYISGRGIIAECIKIWEFWVLQVLMGISGFAELIGVPGRGHAHLFFSAP